MYDISCSVIVIPVTVGHCSGDGNGSSPFLGSDSGLMFGCRLYEFVVLMNLRLVAPGVVNMGKITVRDLEL